MKLKKVLLALGLAVASLCFASCSESFDPANPVIYLEAGAENGSGTEKAPYGDVLDAIAKAKELGLAGAEHITLNYGSGEYALTETLHLNSDDFGGASLEMICEDEEKALICAWLPVTAFTETEVNGVKAWVADMPTLNGETVYSHQFFNDNYERLALPRYPEEGFLRNEYVTNENRDKIECKGNSIYGEDLVNDAFYFYEGDIPETLTRLEDSQVCFIHHWNDERLSVKNIDYETNLIELGAASWMHLVENHPGRYNGLYYLDNVFESLNDPGEVYNDRASGKLYYVPTSDDDINNFTIYVSTIDTMMVIDGMNGSPEKNAFVAKNIGFVGSDWKNVNKGSAQAAAEITAAIQVSNASYMVFEDCAFDHIGNYAVELITGVNNVTFDHCSVTDIGGGGIRLHGVNGQADNPLVLHDITIQDCTISGYGRVYRNAVGLFIQYAHDCLISHNEISDGYYTGINVGWSWGYGFQITSNILIEKNHIYNIGQGLLQDMSGIYCLGEQFGTVIRENLIHDIETIDFGYGGFAYYNDQASTGIVIEKNIGYNCSEAVYHFHFGKDNIVRNNIFAFGRKGGILWSEVIEDHVGFTFERNIIISDYAPIYSCAPNADNYFVEDSNLFWDYTLKEQLISFNSVFEDRTEAWMEYSKNNNKRSMIEHGYYTNAVFADPLFADPFNYDFTLAEDSPAWDIGFEPIDVSDVGPRD